MPRPDPITEEELKADIFNIISYEWERNGGLENCTEEQFKAFPEIAMLRKQMQMNSSIITSLIKAHRGY